MKRAVPRENTGNQGTWYLQWQYKSVSLVFFDIEATSWPPKCSRCHGWSTFLVSYGFLPPTTRLHGQISARTSTCFLNLVWETIWRSSLDLIALFPLASDPNVPTSRFSRWFRFLFDFLLLSKGLARDPRLGPSWPLLVSYKIHPQLPFDFSIVFLGFLQAVHVRPNASIMVNVAKVVILPPSRFTQ